MDVGEACVAEAQGLMFIFVRFEVAEVMHETGDGGLEGGALVAVDAGAHAAMVFAYEEGKGGTASKAGGGAVVGDPALGSFGGDVPRGASSAHGP